MIVGGASTVATGVTAASTVSAIVGSIAYRIFKIFNN